MRSVEQQVRRLVRAWPIPDRVERGDEIVGTTLDLVPEGRSRLPLALAINLIVGGLRARWRMRPPLWRWYSYRMGGRLPARWHRWMLNDLSGPGWRRRVVQSQLIVGLTTVTIFVLTFESMNHLMPKPTGSAHAAPASIVFLLVGAGIVQVQIAVITRFRARKLRDRRLARSGYGQMVRNSPPWPPPSSVESSRNENTGVPNRS